MDLKYCARCGMFFEVKDFEAEDLVLFKVGSVEPEDSGRNGVYLDEQGLCPECASSLKEWFASGKEE